MKKTIYYALLFMIFLGGCEITDDGSYVAPITNYEKINGSWKMSSVKQIDELAKASSSKPDEMVLTQFFNFKDFILTLNVDELYHPTSFEIKGDVPDLFLKSGYWSLDQPHTHSDGTASTILLYTDEAKTQLADELKITTMPGASTTLEFKLIRYNGEIPFVSYQYSLKLIK